MQPTAFSRFSSVAVTVPARLHLGFLDLNGGLGRRFGSIGLTIDGVGTVLRAEPALSVSATGPSADRAAEFARKLAAALAIKGGIAIAMDEAIPEHAGLGSGTQLGLAVGMAYAGLYGLHPQPRQIAQLLGRGARSGIGIGAFELGGVLVDGGRPDTGTAPAPIVARMDFPDAWRVLLVLDESARGLHGSAELEAFKTLPPFPAEVAAHLCRLVLMAALPSLAEADLARFGSAVTEIQDTIGDYFAASQGGRFSSPGVADALAFLRANGAAGVGQSSWGPTGFAFVASEAEGQELVRRAAAKRAADRPLRFVLCRGRNIGGQVELGGAVTERRDVLRR